MYDKRAKQDALDLWFSMPGEMSVDDFAAELGYPSGSTLRNWIKADPRHDPDKCQYRSKPVLPKLEAIRRVAEGATAAQAARETGLTPQQVRYSVGRYARGGTAALLPAPARKRRKGEAVDEGKTRRASRPARPMPCEQPPGLPEELPDDPAALKAIIADLELVSATAKSAERATLSRRRRPRFPAGGATALWPPALPRAAAQGALDRGVVEVRGPDLNLQRRGALGVPGRDRPARDLPSAELREPDRHRDVLCAERGQPPRGVRGPHDCPLSGSPSPSAASASRSFMR